MEDYLWMPVSATELKKNQNGSDFSFQNCKIISYNSENSDFLLILSLPCNYVFVCLFPLQNLESKKGNCDLCLAIMTLSHNSEL